MAKARSRVATRKVKDRWKSKEWYKILAPQTFARAVIAETLADEQEKLLGRVSEISMQDLTGDFKQMHIKLQFQVHEVNGSEANTRFVGHTMTSDYLRRQTRRNRSKIDGVFDVKTKDGSKVRVKPFAMTDRRIQSSQKTAIRKIMAEEISAEAANKTLGGFVKSMLDGTLANRIYKRTKEIYPLRRVEICKSEVMAAPTVELEEEDVLVEPEQPAEEEQTPVVESEEETEEESEEEKTSEPSEDIEKAVPEALHP
ncbi:MAG: 30S ribosomal protein S3ae [Thermoplasmata archaeon HGW-Thermoplasmata-1]|nr:MAG: 30S ribosomal protein S3ae [Thermoplasmata archaeon HGW-Thermoplasmata-1]